MIIVVILSVLLNILLVWYLYKVLAKLLYTSDNLGDLYLITRTYKEMVSSMYGMDMFYGEPVIQELLARSKELVEEIEKFEEIYEITTNIEFEDELDAAEEEKKEN